MSHRPPLARAAPAPPAPAPLTRRARKKQRTRREIYEAAMALFARHGFDAVTIEQICDAADVARATFFHHFPTKSALLFEFNRGLARELAARLRAPAERPDAVSEYRMMVDLFAERWLAQAEVMGAMLREFAATPVAAARVEAEAQDLRELIEDVVRRGQARGDLRRGVDPRLAAVLFLSTSAAILSGAVYRPGEVTPDEVKRQFLEAVLHGLAPRTQESPVP